MDFNDKLCKLIKYSLDIASDDTATSTSLVSFDRLADRMRDTPRRLQTIFYEFYKVHASVLSAPVLTGEGDDQSVNDAWIADSNLNIIYSPKYQDVCVPVSKLYNLATKSEDPAAPFKFMHMLYSVLNVSGECSTEFIDNIEEIFQLIGDEPEPEAPANPMAALSNMFGGMDITEMVKKGASAFTGRDITNEEIGNTLGTFLQGDAFKPETIQQVVATAKDGAARLTKGEDAGEVMGGLMSTMKNSIAPEVAKPKKKKTGSMVA